MSDMERLELYEKLEKAEGRIVALEKQVCCKVVVKTSLPGHSASKISSSPSQYYPQVIFLNITNTHLVRTNSTETNKFNTTLISELRISTTV